jgi:PKD repeat protein
MDPAALAMAKRRAEGSAMLADPAASLSTPPSAPGTRAVVSGTLNQPGLVSADNAPHGYTPPDPTGAVGPNHYFEFVNSKVRVYNKSDLSPAAAAVSLDVFVGAAGHSVFDPQIQWDQQNGRWLYVADDCLTGACSSGNRLAYGFSKTSNPTGGWCNYFIDTGTLFDDYPKLGHNDNFIIVGTNVFAPSFVSARIWTAPKPAPGDITGSCPAAGTPHYWSGPAAGPVRDGTISSSQLRTSDGSLAFTPVPANTLDSSANGYVMAAQGGGAQNNVMAWHIDAAGNLVADGNIGVTAFTAPPNVPQPGTTDKLDSSDSRLTQAVAVKDPGANAEAVWTQHTVSGGGGSVVRWYEFLPASVAKRQEGTISAGAGIFVFNGAISPTMAGDEAAIQYNTGGAAQSPDIRASSRRHNAAVGTMTGEVVLGTSGGAAQDFTCTSRDSTSAACRWGDYAGMSPDPSNPHRVWGTNQLLDAPTSPTSASAMWKTRNFALMVTATEPYAGFATPPAFQNKPYTFDSSTTVDPDSGGAIATWDWDFGDGTPHSNVASPTHTYTMLGPKQVTLTVTDVDNGASDSVTRTVNVLAPEPTASFTVSPATAVRGQSITFDGSASRDAEAPGGIQTYHWDFNDGSPVLNTTSAVVTHSYATLGIFNPTLTVTDVDDGFTSPMVSRTVTIQNIAPVARLTFAPGAPQTNDNVTFDASASTDQDGTIVRYQWALDGDGVFRNDTGATPKITRAYAAAGSYPVNVKVTDNDGATSIASGTVVVSAPPTPPGNPTPAPTQSNPTPGGSPPPGGNPTPGGPTPVALKLTLKGAKNVPLGRAVKSGLALYATCGKPCRLAAIARIPDKAARKLRTNPIVGGALGTLANAGSKKLVVRLNASARRRLKRPEAVTITVTATDADGKTVTGKLVVRLGR